MLEKERRLQKILSVIRAKPVATQGELASLLEGAGFAVTQSSVSRDIAELGVVKRRGRYVVPEAADGAKGRGLLSLQAAGASLVVARCEPGLASAVAVEIDRASIPEIVGTIAGEDTIFVAVADAKAQRAAIKKIWGLFQ
ncbi:MAG: arginine repressor [Acidobacteria bacterium]|nr:arginine repressor [Acidobacteriota bacterium]MCA1643816.1 arginine repressor [Acidobacteriota bacterium]